MDFKTVLSLVGLISVVVSAEAFAGGGGCDGECPPPDPSIPQIVCKATRIEFVRPKTFELDERVKKFANEILESGFEFVLTGDETAIYDLRPMGGRFKRSEFHAYSANYPNSGPSGVTNMFFTYGIRSSASNTDPRPRVMNFFLQVRKQAEWDSPRLRFIASGYFDKEDIWRTSGKPVLGALLKCARPE